MKASRIRIFAASTALLVILAVAAALAQGMHHHGGSMGSQQDQAKAIMEKEKPVIQPLMKQLMEAHKDMSSLEDSGTFDEAKVRALAAQNTQAMTELFVQKARIHAELIQILTPDQKTKLQQLRAKHETRMQEHMQKHAQDTTSN